MSVLGNLETTASIVTLKSLSLSNLASLTFYHILNSLLATLLPPPSKVRLYTTIELTKTDRRLAILTRQALLALSN